MSDPTAPPTPATIVDILNRLLAMREALLRAATSLNFVHFALQLQSLAERIGDLLAKDPEALARALHDARLMEPGNHPPFFQLVGDQGEETQPKSGVVPRAGVGGYCN